MKTNKNKILSLVFLILLTSTIYFNKPINAAGFTGLEVTFSVSPTKIQRSVATMMIFTFKGNVRNLVELTNYCSGQDLIASVVSPLDNGQDAGFRDNIDPIKLSSLKSGQVINWDFQKEYTHLTTLNYRVFQGVVRCGGKEVTRSGTVQVTVLEQSGTGGSGGSGGTEGADGTGGQTFSYPFKIDNPLKGGANDVAGLVKVLAAWVFKIAVPIAVAMIVYAGVLFLISRGDKGQVDKARKTLWYAVIGLAIIIIGSGFIALIRSILELGGNSTGSTQYNQQDGQLPGSGTSDSQDGGFGELGSPCGGANDVTCNAGLGCSNGMCTQLGGNDVGDPCRSTSDCVGGLTCDLSQPQDIDGQIRGTCWP